MSHPLLQKMGRDYQNARSHWTVSPGASQSISSLFSCDQSLFVCTDRPTLSELYMFRCLDETHYDRWHLKSLSRTPIFFTMAQETVECRRFRDDGAISKKPKKTKYPCENLGNFYVFPLPMNSISDRKGSPRSLPLRDDNVLGHVGGWNCSPVSGRGHLILEIKDSCHGRLIERPQFGQNSSLRSNFGQTLAVSTKLYSILTFHYSGSKL